MPPKASEPANKKSEDPVERCRRLIQSWWPEAADDDSSNLELRREPALYRFCIGGDQGVIVYLGLDGVEIDLPTVTWEGPHTPVAATKLWRRCDYEGLQEDDLHNLLKKGIKARKRQFRKCRYCGQKTPPEHRISADVCHGCATEHLHVIY